MSLIQQTSCLRNLQVHFVNGLNGVWPNRISDATLNDLNIVVSDTWRDPYHGTVMRHGEIGCAVGHLSIWREIAAARSGDAAAAALIFEDDTTWEPSVFDTCMARHACQLIDSNNWDMLYLSRKCLSSQPEVHVSKDVVLAKYSYWANAYVLTVAGATKLCRAQYVSHLIPVDEFLPYLYDPEVRAHFTRECLVPSDVYQLPSEPFVALALCTDICTQGGGGGGSRTFLSHPIQQASERVFNLQAITVATDMNDGVRQYMRCATMYGYSPRILGLGQPWQGGNMRAGAGGGQKVRLLLSYIQSLPDDTDLDVVLFTDAYDVAILAPPQMLLKRFHAFQCDMVFAAELHCWPQPALADAYPKQASSSPYRYLNSGCFIAKLGALKRLLCVMQLPADHEDDQLYYTRLYLSQHVHPGVSIRLDHQCHLFQCNVSRREHVELDMYRSRIKNTLTHSTPCIMHGNGGMADKIAFNNLCNYVGGRWTPTYGFNASQDESAALLVSSASPYTVHVVMYIDGTSSMPLMHIPHDIATLCKCSVVKRISVVCHGDHAMVKAGLQQCEFDEDDDDNDIIPELIKCASLSEVIRAYQDALTDTAAAETEALMMITPFCELNKADLTELFEHMPLNRYGVLSPLCVRPDTLYSNFWGDVDPASGYYKRAWNYIDIVQKKQVGVWNVPYVNHCVLVDKAVRADAAAALRAEALCKTHKDFDMLWCSALRAANIFMYVDNRRKPWTLRHEFDQASMPALVVPYFTQRDVWKVQHLHPLCVAFLETGQYSKDFIQEPVADAYTFPLFTEAFCQQLIDRAEEVNAWSSGTTHDDTHYDPRIGNVESYPTVDVHVQQLGLDSFWKDFVMHVVSKIAKHVYTGYVTKGYNIAFVVRYDLEGQQKLAPHHDASTYTINIALNAPGRDYQGGGVHFIRQNKQVVDLPVGHCLMHPGKLTHYHEGLPITGGTRYIFVTFVN